MSNNAMLYQKNIFIKTGPYRENVNNKQQHRTKLLTALH